MKSPSASLIAPMLAAAALAAALYACTLGGTFVYDDLYYARDDERLQDVHRWRQFLTKQYGATAVDALWRPLASFSYAVQHKLHGDRAWPFHLVNLLLHAAVSAQVAALAGRLAGRRAAYVAGLLFAAHPIHVEVVAGIVGRSEEVAALGILGALLIAIGHTLTPRRAWAILGCFCLAVLSKENGLLLPAMLLVWAALRWEYRKRHFITPAVDPAAKPALRQLVAMLTMAMALYIFFHDRAAPWYWDPDTIDWWQNPLFVAKGPSRWLIPVAASGRYAAMLALPLRLSPDYSANVFLPKVDPRDPYLYLGFLTIAAYLAGLAWAWRRRVLPAVFCLACLAISYALASNLTIIGTIFGERLMYLPSAFLLVLIGWAAARVPARVLAAAMAIVLVAACWRAVTYALLWNDPLRLFQYAISHKPQSVQLHRLLAGQLHQRGDEAGRRRLLEEGRAIGPNFVWLWIDSAHEAHENNRPEEAEEYAHTAFKILRAPATGALWQEMIDALEASRTAATRPVAPPATRPAPTSAPATTRSAP